jgi:ATP-dependent RNA helicase DDX47/RRP3
VRFLVNIPSAISNELRRYQTVSTLLQYYLFMPLQDKDTYLVSLANSLAQNSMIIFTRTVHDAGRYENCIALRWRS